MPLFIIMFEYFVNNYVEHISATSNPLKIVLQEHERINELKTFINI